jgi:rhomboid family GlyGly-CTERM serine protease
MTSANDYRDALRSFKGAVHTLFGSLSTWANLPAMMKRGSPLGLAGVVAALIAAAVLVQWLGEPARHALQYERGAVLRGEVWRLLSAHLVHLSWAHLWLNAAALPLVALLWWADVRPAQWAWMGLLASLGVGVGLLVCSPQVAWYVGLSGTVHGWVAAGSVMWLRHGRRAGWVGLAALAGKLGWEQMRGALPTSAALIGGATVVDAHLYGAVGGLVAALVWGARLPGSKPQA